jgi:hypothetical protein
VIGAKEHLQVRLPWGHETASTGPCGHRAGDDREGGKSSETTSSRDRHENPPSPLVSVSHHLRLPARPAPHPAILLVQSTWLLLDSKISDHRCLQSMAPGTSP